MNKNQAAALSIISNSTLIVFKLTAGILMGSISVLSEAIHSSIDLLASLIAFFSIRKACQPKDDGHPFGHGKYENVSGFVEAILILIAALLIVYESVNKLFMNSKVENVWSGIIVMFVASAINFCISMTLLRISKKTHSIALEADAMHLLTDVFTSMGVFLGLILLKFTGIQMIDPITGIFVAALIMKTSISLIRKSMTDLVDSKLPDEDIKKIVEVLNSYPQILNYHKLRTRKSGEIREVDFHIIVNKNASVIRAHDLCDSVEKDIKKKLPQTDITIHIEPFQS